MQRRPPCERTQAVPPDAGPNRRLDQLRPYLEGLFSLDRQLGALGQLKPFVRRVEEVPLRRRFQLLGDSSEFFRSLAPALGTMDITIHDVLHCH